MACSMLCTSIIDSRWQCNVVLPLVCRPTNALFSVTVFQHIDDDDDRACMTNIYVMLPYNKETPYCCVESKEICIHTSICIRVCLVHCSMSGCSEHMVRVM